MKNEKVVHLLYQGLLHVIGPAANLEEAADLARAYVNHPCHYIAEDYADAYVVGVLPPRTP